MNLYKLHSDPKSLDHHDKSFKAVPSLLRTKLMDDWFNFPDVDDWFAEVHKHQAIFARTPEDAVWYATMTQQPFKEAEKVIATDAGASLAYSTEVLKARFPAGEEAIRKNPRAWKLYEKKWHLKSQQPKPEV